MSREFSLFIGTFSTLLAIINPFEVLPVYLKLLEGKDNQTHRQVAWKSCGYALLLCLFFLILGTLLLRLFGVPLSMVEQFKLIDIRGGCFAADLPQTLKSVGDGLPLVTRKISEQREPRSAEQAQKHRPVKQCVAVAIEKRLLRIV